MGKKMRGEGDERKEKTERKREGEKAKRGCVWGRKEKGGNKKGRAERKGKRDRKWLWKRKMQEDDREGERETLRLEEDTKRGGGRGEAWKRRENGRHR